MNLIDKKDLPNSTPILIMGILSLVLCGPVGLVLAIIALNMAKKAYAEYDNDSTIWSESSFNNLKAGKTCATIGIILSSLMLVFLIIYFIFIFYMISNIPEFNNLQYETPSYDDGYYDIFLNLVYRF